MTSLDRNLRKQLENRVKDARRVAEAGARQSIEQLAVHHHEPWATLSPDQRKLRNRLRAHGRQLGDRLDERKGTQPIDRLVGECAYEHWHRLLFARFLAENDLLVEPQSGVALSLDECRELARERGVDWLVLASDFAQRMLPQIFRSGDPVLEVTLPPEKRQELEALLEALPRDVFVADDSLGWVYQFWQAEQKDAVNKSEKKIGADELPAVTQLFTEDYMVLFLLHNTLGAWWAGKVLGARSELAQSADSEDELRRACALPGVDWTYLRFVQVDAAWRPAAGTFDGWPKAAKDLRVLDPCMGSGHFLAFALPIVAAMRMAEEGFSKEAAVDGVLRENLFGLEIDPRCTQIAAFNLALAAWRMAGYRVLPRLHLACSGLSVGAKESEWLALANGDVRLQAGMKRLYDLFQQGPTLGSLIDPRALGGDLLEAGFRDLAPLLEQAVTRERADETALEIAVTASGLAHAAEIVAGSFSLVVTNVPYLGRGKQDEVLKDYCERVHPEAKADLGTCFVERCLGFCAPGGSAAIVTAQNWLYLGPYRQIRERLLRMVEWDFVAWLGPKGFQTPMWDFNVVLIGLTRRTAASSQALAGWDVSEAPSPLEKARHLQSRLVCQLSQKEQLENPDGRVLFERTSKIHALEHYAESFKGIATGDLARFIFNVWELPAVANGWRCLQGSVNRTTPYGGRDQIVLWEDGRGRLFNYVAERLGPTGTGAWLRGEPAWGRLGVAVAQISSLTSTLFLGDLFDESTAAIIPKDSANLNAVWAYCSSHLFPEEVRKLDDSMKVPTLTLLKIPFDLEHWRRVAGDKCPQGLPRPQSDDPTQWLFSGHPRDCAAALHVATARLLGYRWPRQTGSSFPDCPELGLDGLESSADEDGIVCLSALKGEPAAVERLRALLAAAYGLQWSSDKMNELLSSVGFSGRSIDDWLRHGFFEQHCDLFQQRPFIWHVWDGLENGFSALVNYHRLAAPNGEGRRSLEKLIYTYLGDWIDRQRADQKDDVEGADARVAAAEHIKRELEKILEGEPPYDIFVRWKPLYQQPLGWEPDLDDGVRINIRPFMTAKLLNTRGKNASILRVAPKIKWDKDRGKEPVRPKTEYPWFWTWDVQTKDFLGASAFDGSRWNDLHYSRAVKLAARERVKGGKP